MEMLAIGTIYNGDGWIIVYGDESKVVEFTFKQEGHKVVDCYEMESEMKAQLEYLVEEMDVVSVHRLRSAA